MKTITVKSSFWVGDIVYGIIAKHKDSEILTYSVCEFVIEEMETTPEDGPVKMYIIKQIDGGRKFCCADDEITKSCDEVNKQLPSLSSDMKIGLNGRNLYCGEQVICSCFENPMNEVHEVEILSETAGVSITNDGVKGCILYVTDGVNAKEYK